MTLEPRNGTMTTTTPATCRRQKGPHRRTPAPCEPEPAPTTIPTDGGKPKAVRRKTSPKGEESYQPARPARGTKTTKKAAPYVPLKKDGTPKKVLSWNDKLRVLDPTASPERTEARFNAFKDLFARRLGDASQTKARGGPKDWTALHGLVERNHVARHLLADRVPTLRPQWLAARSFKTARYFAFDVDAHGVKGQRTFERRCRRVEDALRSVGIDPDDPLQVLVQRTPSGGRHYYVFFDDRYFLDNCADLWNSLGLNPIPGEIEFFPSESHALRLPFGHIPDAERDPRAWIKFIDNYTSRRFKRFNLPTLYEAAHRPMPTAPASQPKRNTFGPAHTATARDVIAPTAYLGIPKSQCQPRPAATRTDATTVPIHPDADARFLELIEQGPKSLAEAEELLNLGIRIPGTRNAALKILAAHHVWFRGLSAQRSAEILTAWAYDPRHESKDIRYDLDHGTTRVATDIASMCAWYEERNEPQPGVAAFRPHEDTNPQFAQAEIEALRSLVASVPPELRHGQANFLLSFMGFAKRHGRPNPDGKGWEAAPAVARVIRGWPGCNHSKYKPHMRRATEAGLFAMTKEKYQAPPGQKGRARTYCLSVPVVAQEGWTLDYDAALKALTENRTVDPEIPTPVPSFGVNTLETEEPSDDRTHRPSDINAEHHAGGHAADLREEGATAGVGPRPPQRDLLGDAVRRIPGPADGRIRTVRTDDLRTVVEPLRGACAGNSARGHQPVTQSPPLNAQNYLVRGSVIPQPTSTSEPSFAEREAAILGLEDDGFPKKSRHFQSPRDRAEKNWVASPLRRNNPDKWRQKSAETDRLRNPEAAAGMPQTTCWNGDSETSPL